MSSEYYAISAKCPSIEAHAFIIKHINYSMPRYYASIKSFSCACFYMRGDFLMRAWFFALHCNPDKSRWSIGSWVAVLVNFAGNLTAYLSLESSCILLFNSEQWGVYFCVSLYYGQFVHAEFLVSRSITCNCILIYGIYYLIVFTQYRAKWFSNHNK